MISVSEFTGKLSTVIIEDEDKARQHLIKLLRCTGLLNITGEAATVTEGAALIRRLKPDVVFLDVELKDGNGFDILGQLTEIETIPYLVFTTAYDKYAFKAIKYSAFDYLLKPVTSSDIEACLKKILDSKIKRQNPHDFANFVRQLSAGQQKLRFNTTNGFTLFNPDEILYIQADNNYCEL